MGERSLQGAEVGALRAPARLSLRLARPRVAIAVVTGFAGFCLLPWNAIGGQGFLAFQWLASYPTDVRVAPAIVQLAWHGRLWLLAPLVALAVAIGACAPGATDRQASRMLIASGVIALLSILGIALAIDITGWTWPALASVFGELPRRQPGLGMGALVTAAASLAFVCHGVALRGWVKGDAFIAGAIGASVALVTLFTIFPITRLLLRAFADGDGHLSLAAFATRVASSRIWSKGGVVWNSLQVGAMTATSATLLALCFALVVTRTRTPGRRMLGVLAVLPMITPPFVIGLALIMLFGRSGAINALLEMAFGVRPTRWIYGLPGVWLAQTLALTPVAYLLITGVVEGVSASFEEAAQTLRASRWQTFASVTLPLLAPGLANAFLLVFIESLADFGNPLLLGGNLEVLSVSI